MYAYRREYYYENFFFPRTSFVSLDLIDRIFNEKF